MGNSQSHSQKAFLEDWVQLQKTAVNTGNSNIWASKKDRKIQMEQYPLYVTSLQEVKQQKKIHQFRKNHPQVVSSMYFIDETQEQFCASNYQGKIFLERIPLSLANVGDIPFPDALHLYSQALQGFHVLASQVQQGCFPVSEQHIGINCNSIVKVWMNTLYHKNYPNRNQRISEEKMVRMILDIIQSNVDYQSAGLSQNRPPNLSKYIYENSKAPSEVKFNQAINIFRDYVNRFFGGRVPQRLNCVDKIGGSDYLYKSWNEQAKKYHQPQVYSQPHALDSTRGFTKTSTIPYQNVNNFNTNANESYTEFKRQEPIVSNSNFNSSQGFNGTRVITGNNLITSPSQQQFSVQPPIINYSPSGFLNVNNSINGGQQITNQRPSTINTPSSIPQNQILIKSNVRSVQNPVKGSQIITNVPLAQTSSINWNTKFEQNNQNPTIVYQPSNYTQVSNINSNPTVIQRAVLTSEQAPVVSQSAKFNINFQTQPIRRQFQQSIIQNRIVPQSNQKVSQNIITTTRQEPLLITQQQRSIYVPMPSRNAIQKNISAPIVSTEPIVNQNINPQRVTSQMIVMDKKINNNSPSNTYSKQSINQNEKSPYNYNKSVTQELSNSKYQSLKLDDGMSSAAFLNQLKNLKNISTTKQSQFSQYKDYAPTKYEQNIQTRYSQPSQQYKYYYQTGQSQDNQNYMKKYEGSLYQNLNLNNQNYEENGYQQQHYQQGHRRQNQDRNNSNNNEQEIRYEYKYSQEPQGQHAQNNNSQEYQYKSYFDKYANYGNYVQKSNEKNSSPSHPTEQQEYWQIQRNCMDDEWEETKPSII